jgi:hexosaminidase
MKKPLFIFCFICSSLFLFAQSSGDAALSLIPQPVSIVQAKGSLVLPHQLTIYTDNNAEVNRIANTLSLQLASNFYKVKVGPGKKPLAKAIHLYLTNDISIPDEGYRLKVSATGVSLSARTPSGIFYGIQTLLQLFPKEIVNKDGHIGKTMVVAFSNY